MKTIIEFNEEETKQIFELMTESQLLYYEKNTKFTKYDIKYQLMYIIKKEIIKLKQLNQAI